MGPRTDIDGEEALRLHAEGWTQLEIARRVACSPLTLRRGLQARGVRTDRRWKRMRRRHGKKLHGLWVFLWRRCEVPAG